MELSQLEVFLAVAREHRFSRAAEKLYRTQSAVSQTIRKLEDELGESLLTVPRGKAFSPMPGRCSMNTPRSC
jgi:DNA-binding transcriptional LysR family regulator